jgi:DNA-directed RNA polymerase subunit RPC12/RpoP
MRNSVRVEDHFREPQEQQGREEEVCLECKEPLEEGVKKHCMMFHAACWEVVRDGYIHRKQYIKCAVCGEKVLEG